MSYHLGKIDPEERAELYADPRDEEAAEAPRPWLRLTTALVVMGVFAGGLWLAYAAGTRHAGSAANGDNVPLIRADTRPWKVKPENPGGMQIPDRNMLIYGEQNPQIEHLLPPPEQPMPRPEPPPPPAPPPAQSAAAAPLPVAAAAGPAQSGEAAPAAEPKTPATAAASAPAVPPAAPSRSEAEPTRETGVKTGRLRLQLGAVRSEGEARDEWQRLKARNPDLLGHLAGVAIRVDLAGKGVYYRIQAGPLADVSAAGRICDALRERHLGCMIVR